MPILADLKSANHKAPSHYGDQPYDVLIVGAGILGCAAAVTLARQGRSVVLLERNLNEPDRIVGELLQPGGVAALEKLAMGECLEGIDAIPVKGYRVFYRGESITFWYPPVGV
jgi:squalene monooxygenase